MRLSPLDWAAILAYLLISLLLGLYFRRRSAASTEEYFVSGRRASWWLAGTSMVATTFAADTPLVVSGLVYTQGIAGNWLWWSALPSGILTVFLYARLWHRAGLLTDVQFAELRYAGRPAAVLRGFRALYLGLLMNCLILGWVTKAMMQIASVSLGISDSSALALCIFVLIPLTGIYSSLGGLWGVLWTDLFQFVLMMTIIVVVAVYAVGAVGGMPALLDKLEAARVAGGGAASDATAFLPDFSRGLTGEARWTLPLLTFLVFLTVQWWAAWYPGAEPGGGGYVAQRIFSTRSEREGLLSVLWFNVAHYAIRPWPWILVGLTAVVLYPNLTRSSAESSYMLVATNHLPPALRGLLVAGFLAAFMSTVATHLNWGSSYLVSDFYRRFVRTAAAERHYVHVGRLVTLLLVVLTGIVSWQLASIREGWKFVLEVGAGTGAVYLLRWYWWRINAWSEIAAMSTALLVSVGLRWAQPFSGPEFLVFAKNALVTTGVTTLVWLAVTLVTPPEPAGVLLNFYRRVRPDVTGWGPVALAASDVAPTHDLVRNLLSWLLGCGMVYSALFAIGRLCFGHYPKATQSLAIFVFCTILLVRRLRVSPT